MDGKLYPGLIEMGKIIKMFAVVGLNENNISRYNDSDNKMDFIQNIDIINNKKNDE